MTTKAWLKPDQVQALRDAAHDDAQADYLQLRNDALVALQYDTGLRPGELAGLTTEMFHEDDSTLRLPSSVQKDYPTDSTPPPVTMALAQDEWTRDTVVVLKNWLRNRWKDSLYIFPSRESEAMTTQNVRKTMQRLAEIGDVRPYIGFDGQGDTDDIDGYTLRHSVAYRMLSARDDGTTMYDVRNRMRHRSLQTTERHYDFFDTV